MSRNSLISHVKKTINNRKLFNAGDTIVVGLSGGADSCVLLDILVKLTDIPVTLIVAHINHCLRGNDSDADEAHAGSLAALHNLQFESCRVDVAGLTEKSGLNLEDAGRQVRIGFLEKIRIKYNASAIALAHHADDQAETVLMRFLRGSGTTGLSGMAFANGYMIRPLLDVYRAEIDNYILSNSLSFREDQSNSNIDFLRNRIRHELLPLLKDYNPNIRKQLNVTANLLAEENVMLDSMAKQILAEAGSLQKNRYVLSLNQLINQPMAMKRRCFRCALENIVGNLNSFSHIHIEALIKLSESSRPNAQLDLPQGVRAAKEYDVIVLSRCSKAGSEKEETIIVNGDGDYRLFNGYGLVVSTVAGKQDFTQYSVKTAFIDLDKAPFPWEIRSWVPGDRIMPLGLQGTKKVKDVFINKKIPLSERGHIPLVFSQRKLIWIGGICNSEQVKIDDNTDVIVKVTLTDDYVL